MDPLVYKIILVLAWLIFLSALYHNYFGFSVPPLKKIDPGVSPPIFSVAIFGDCQGADNPFTSLRPTYFVFNNILEQINESQPLFTAILGDMVSSGRAYHLRRFRRQILRLATPVYAILGNHDAKYQGRRVFTGLFGPAYYSFPVDANGFIFLDNAEGSLDAAQLAWLETQLEDNRFQNIYIFLHQPVFDPRPGCNYAMSDRQQADHLKELFSARRVKAVFASHLHGFYQTKSGGVSYYVTGGAGSTLTSPADYYHYLKLDISGDTFKVSVARITSRPSLDLSFIWFFGLLSFAALAVFTFFAAR